MALVPSAGFEGSLEVLGLGRLGVGSFGTTVSAQYSAVYQVEDELTWLGKFLGDSPRLSSAPRSFRCGFFVRLVLDSVLFEVRIVQILFQRVNERDRRLFLRVRRKSSSR